MSPVVAHFHRPRRPVGLSYSGSGPTLPRRPHPLEPMLLGHAGGGALRMAGLDELQEHVTAILWAHVA